MEAAVMEAAVMEDMEVAVMEDMGDTEVGVAKNKSSSKCKFKK